MKRSYTRLPRTQEFQIASKLQEVCSRTPEGYAQYITGWDDHAVLEYFKAAIPNITITNVQGLRMEFFGKVRVPKPAAVERHFGSRDEALAFLTDRVKRLEEQNDDFLKRVAQLEDVITRPRGGFNGSTHRHQ